MKSNDFTKSFIAAAVLIIIFVVFWEFFWRSKGYAISFNDDKVIWASARKKVYAPSDRATVFIGSSRIKFDIDIPTWKALTGEDAIQLALVGTSPRPVLHNLARDENFRGKVIMDVQEHAFFSMDSVQREKSARDAIEYFQKETPAQKVNAAFDYVLESNFVFLEEGKFGLNALLNGLNIPNRPGIVIRNGPPKDFSQFSQERQASMTPMFLENKEFQNRLIQYWSDGAALNKSKPIKGSALDAYFHELKISIDKIRSRGGIVVFVRPPSSGKFLERENRDYPRSQYWDLLLKSTRTEGFYYADYPETAYFVCLEESHLTPEDAINYTTALVNILKERESWTFRGTSNSSANPVKR
jgi:hypothetical protein